MRTIKFRAISECRGEHWMYGDLRHYNRNPHTEKWTIHDPTTGMETDIDPNTIGQFTGLYDKNGKEIYEGDIIRLQNSREASQIVYQCGQWVLYDNRAMWISLSDVVCLFGDKVSVIEVINNIHDTPELMKGGLQ